MSMGPQNKSSTSGGHAKRIFPNNVTGQTKRPVLAEYLSHAFSVHTTRSDFALRPHTMRRAGVPARNTSSDRLR